MKRIILTTLLLVLVAMSACASPQYGEKTIQLTEISTYNNINQAATNYKYTITLYPSHDVVYANEITWGYSGQTGYMGGVPRISLILEEWWTIPSQQYSTNPNELYKPNHYIGNFIISGQFSVESKD